MIIKKYHITNSKITKNLTIAIFSDIHYSNNYNHKKLEKILKSLKDNPPNYICIPGDIVDNSNILDDKENQVKILTFFKQLGKIAPTFISLGNHDNTRLENNITKKENHIFWKNQFKNLKKDNIYLLNNEIYENDKIRIIGFVPEFNYYHNKQKEELIEVLIKNFNQKIPKIDNKKINVLICHSPIKMLDKEAIESINQLKYIDIVISGHMHNGMVPNILDKIFPKNRGIISPNKKIYPNNARGIKTVQTTNKEITLIISGAITKIPQSVIKILQLGNCLYKPQMEYLKITKNK